MKKLILALLLAVPAFGATFPIQIPAGASDPATCNPASRPGERNLFWNTTSSVLKYCSATNTWTAIGSASGTLTNAAVSLPVNQILVGNGYPDTLTTNCTISSVATDALYCPGGFYGLAQTATNDATKPIAHEAMKWVATNGWTLAVSGTDMSDPSLSLANATAASSLVRPESPGSQISAVSHDAVVTGQFAQLYATAGSDGQLTSVAACTVGQMVLGTWAETAAAGTRLLNYSPRKCVPTAFGTAPAADLVTKAAGADPTTNNCVKWLAGGGVGDAGTACGSSAAASPVWFNTQAWAGSVTGISPAANATKGYEVVVPYQVTCSTIDFWIQTSDNTAATYDIGLYDATSALSSLALVGHLGATAGSTWTTVTGHKTAAWSGGGSKTFGPGRYIISFTGSATTLKFGVINSGATGQPINGTLATVNSSTSGGALNASGMTFVEDWTFTGSSDNPVFGCH